MTRAELAIALDRALYHDGGPAPTRGVSAADAIDTYVRGLIARCRIVHGQGMWLTARGPEGRTDTVMRLSIDDEPALPVRQEVVGTSSGFVTGPEDAIRFSPFVQQAIASAVEAERAACEAVCRMAASRLGYANNEVYMAIKQCETEIAARKPKAGGE